MSKVRQITARTMAAAWQIPHVTQYDATDITDIENVELVFKDGIGYDSAKLIASAKGVVGLR